MQTTATLPDLETHVFVTRSHGVAGDMGSVETADDFPDAIDADAAMYFAIRRHDDTAEVWS